MPLTSLPFARRARRFFGATLLLALSIPAVGELPPIGPGDIIEPVRTESGANNDHPVALDPLRLYQALTRLETQLQPAGIFGSREPVRTAIFTEQQLEQLVPHLVNAFAGLKRDQDLGISVAQARRSNELGFLSGSRTTSARVFHADGEVHLIFGQVEKDVSLERERPGRAVPNAPASLGLDRGIGLLEAIGSRKRPTRLDWSPVLPDGARLIDSARNDWIAVRPDAFQPVTDAVTGKATQESSPDRESSTGAVDSLRTPDSKPPSKTPEKVPAEAPGTNRSAAPAEDPVEQKLRLLKRYYEQGLIDEELYQQKVRELIDGALGAQR